MQPRPPALETAAARGLPETRAMPARRMGCWIPRRVVRGVVRGPEGDIVGEANWTFVIMGGMRKETGKLFIQFMEKQNARHCER